MTRHAGAWSLLALLVFTLPASAGAKEDLWEAARKGDVKAVESLLAKGADVNAKTRYGATALWFAAYKDQLAVVKVLLAHKADVNVRDDVWGQTPLIMAAYSGQAEIAALLAGAGARDTGAALVQAAHQGHTKVVRALLEKGIGEAGAIHAALVAAPDNRPEIAKMLREAGAPPPPKATADADKLKARAGVYESPTGSRITVLFQKGSLLTRASSGDLHVWEPADGDVFRSITDKTATLAFQRHGERVASVVFKRAKEATTFDRIDSLVIPGPKGATDEGPLEVIRPRNWPSFRGDHASGVADGQRPPTTWDAAKGTNVRWKTAIPGLAHSSPVVWGERVFVTTAVSSDPNTEFKPGLYGAGTPAKDVSRHQWCVWCLDRRSGEVVWSKVAHEGVPKIKRHIKSSQANATPATDGKRLVAYFASEGLYCYDPDGRLLWKKDLGLVDCGAFNDPEQQWGAASSPILYRNMVIVQCDRQKDSFIAAYHADTGEQVWRTARDEGPSWGTPTVYEGPGRPELIANGTNAIRGYDPLTGKELWRLRPNSQITVPAPVVGHRLIFVTSGYRPIQPIYAVRPGATGDISLKEGAEASDAIAWSKMRGGPYMPTPIVYDRYLYTCSNNGVLTCYEARTGEQVYRQRISSGAGYSGSPVAADGKLYLASEDGDVRVVRAGPRYELLAVNRMGDYCMATPAISDGMLLVRTQHHLFAIGRPPAKKD
jgi:outer membrane protein assembly factor BamB